jgi:hypothetical protein
MKNAAHILRRIYFYTALGFCGYAFIFVAGCIRHKGF